MVDLKIQDRMDQAGKKSEESEARMTFGEHIEELRGRLLKSIVFLMVATVVSLFFYNELVWFITRPHVEVMKKLGIPDAESRDRKSVVSGKSVDLGGRRISKKTDTS